MKINKKLLVLIIASFVGNIVIYPFVPEAIPHRNFEMAVDGYTDKWTLFLMPLTTAFMYFLLFFLGKLDKRNELNKKTYELITVMTVLFFIIMNVWFVLYSFGYEFGIIRILVIVFGIIFVLLGNYLPRIKANSVFGIRTTWTLKNEQVWKNTHRFGGYVLVATGFISLVCSFLEGFIAIIIIFIMAFLSVLVTSLFSYVNYKRLINHE